jgi:hypothetical protein
MRPALIVTLEVPGGFVTYIALPCATISPTYREFSLMVIELLDWCACKYFTSPPRARGKQELDRRPHFSSRGIGVEVLP